MNKKKRRNQWKLNDWLIFVVLVLFAIVILYPLFWMVISSMKDYNEIYSDVWGLPKKWLIGNFKTAWDKGIASYFLNSLIVTIATIIGVVFIGSMAAYSLARFRTRFVDVAVIFIMLGMMVNPQVCLIPLYNLLNQFHLVNTRWALILPYIAFRLPLTILLLRSYFLGISHELEEAAIIDGCSDFGIYYKIYLPMAKPIIITTVVLTAYYAWNEFLFATIFINSESLKTIPSGLMNFRDALKTDWGVLLAGMVISVIPMILLLIFLQKHLIRGLSEGSVKG